MLHHSFEHTPDPHNVFLHLKRLLADDGTIIIRIPLVDGYAWRRYGVHWRQIDAPRHFFLHTKKSISILASSVGLKVEKIEYDSLPWSIIASERLQGGKPSKEFEKAASKKVEELNALMDGDQACFYIRHA